MSSLVRNIVNPVVGIGLVGVGLVKAGASYLRSREEATAEERAKYMDLTSQYEGKDLAFLQKRLKAVENRIAKADAQRCINDGRRLLSSERRDADEVTMAALPAIEAEMREIAALQAQIQKVQARIEDGNRILSFL